MITNARGTHSELGVMRWMDEGREGEGEGKKKRREGGNDERANQFRLALVRQLAF